MQASLRCATDGSNHGHRSLTPPWRVLCPTMNPVVAPAADRYDLVGLQYYPLRSLDINSGGRRARRIAPTVANLSALNECSILLWTEWTRRLDAWIAARPPAFGERARLLRQATGRGLRPHRCTPAMRGAFRRNTMMWRGRPPSPLRVGAQ